MKKNPGEGRSLERMKFHRESRRINIYSFLSRYFNHGSEQGMFLHFFWALRKKDIYYSPEKDKVDYFREENLITWIVLSRRKLRRLGIFLDDIVLKIFKRHRETLLLMRLLDRMFSWELRGKCPEE